MDTCTKSTCRKIGITSRGCGYIRLSLVCVCVCVRVCEVYLKEDCAVCEVLVDVVDEGAHSKTVHPVTEC